MKTKILLIIITIIAAAKLYSQPVISYITPDIASPGLSLYMEIIGPHDAYGNFGTDGIYINGDYADATIPDKVIIQTANPDDSNKVSFGPVMVSWGGRMISTYVYVNPDLNISVEDWQDANAPFVDIQVSLNDTLSNTHKFYLLKPYSFDAALLASETVFGEGNLGKRSPRGAMLVDNLELANLTYTASTNDCDPNTPGNQGYLPFTLIATESITGQSSLIQVNGLDASVSVDENGKGTGGHGGPGGGGGGGVVGDDTRDGIIFPHEDKGEDGGNGFTGGGRGATNHVLVIGGGGSFKNPGIGSGEGVNGEIGYSLNGVSRAFDGGYESTGGGTGHPFGISGEGVWDAKTGDPNKYGGFGGGTGYIDDEPGGGGGYGTNGNHTADRFGQKHGNIWGIPLAGGSGGASGNPYTVTFHTIAGDGGGGGGALALYSPLIENINLHSKGGQGGKYGSYNDVVGGGGSGGYIGVYTKLNTDIQSITVDGGLGGGNQSSSKGGLGYARVDYPDGNVLGLPPAEVTSRGISTDTSHFVKQNFTLTGSNNPNLEPFDLYIKRPTTNWQLLKTVDTPDKNWSEDITLPGNDDVYYLAMIQKIPDDQRNNEPYLYDPPAVMSHAATNILVIERKPIMVSETEFIKDSINCKGSSFTFYFPIWNEGDDTLDIQFNRPNFVNKDRGFSLVSPITFQKVAPGDTVWVEVKYEYNGVDTDIEDILQLLNNDPKHQREYEILFVVQDAVETDFELISGNPYFGEIKINQTIAEQYVFENSGTAPALIDINDVNITGTNYVITDIQPPLPALINPGEQITFNVEFTPDAEGIFTEKLEFFSTKTDKSCTYSGELELTGVGVKSTVELSDYEFDFGIVPYCQIVSDTLTIYNPAADFKITEMPEVETANSDFLGLYEIEQIGASISYPHLMKKGDIVKYLVFFKPNKVKGDTDSRIKIKTNATGFETIYVQLKATIEIFDVLAEPDAIDLGDVWVGFDRDTTFSLVNYGLLEKGFLNNFEISNPDLAIINLQSILLVAPNSGKADFQLNYRIMPNSCGVDGFNEEIKIIFDTPCLDSVIIPITANCLFSEVISSDTLDLGILNSCEVSLPQTIDFWNGGEAPYILLSERWEGDDDVFTIDNDNFEADYYVYNDVNPIELKLITVNANGRTDGTYYANYIVSIFTNGEIIEDTVTAKVQIVRGDYTVSPSPLVFESTFINQTREEIITFTNNGPWDITISDIRLQNPTITEFELINPLPIGNILAQGEFAEIRVRFAPFAEGIFANDLIIDFMMPDCDFTETINISGTADPSQKISIILPDLKEVMPDIDEYSIPIYLKMERIDGILNNFSIDSVEVSFNRSVFYPISVTNGNIFENKVIDNNRVITFTLENISILNDTNLVEIGRINGSTMLGDSKLSDIIIDKAVWSDFNQVNEILTENGSIELTICQAGDDRLLTFSNNSPSIFVEPNPANSILNIRLNLLEAGQNDLNLISITGNREHLISYQHNVNENPEKTFVLDLSSYSSGVYYLQLQSLTVNKIIPVFIIK